MHNYTPEDLIQFLYGELSPAEASAIEEALKKDWTLREKLAVIKTSQERLNTIQQSPRTEAVLNILKYAYQTQKVQA
jgi:anti-sigma factor RsiW